MSDLPNGWRSVESRSTPGRFYYVNDQTGEKVWEKPSNETVRALHILKKHNMSRRPASWRNPQITQSLEDAVSQIKDIRNKLLEVLNRDGGDEMIKLFRSIAKTESDCSSAEKGGDLGRFGRGIQNIPYCLSPYTRNTLRTDAEAI